MNSSLRVLLTCLAVLFCCLPATSSVGGGGESGIWILPSSDHVDASPLMGSARVLTPRATLDLTSISTGLFMVMPPDMGRPLATVREGSAQQPLPAYTYGNRVFLPMFTLAYVRDSVVGQASGLIVDSTGQGFVLTITRNGTNGLRLQIY